ncbi:hypothetical protein LC593_31910 [Nostoc sp. CHAB 5844]|nr:hypothetical protein [Nostoc sp. CHAB 5844]
MCSSSPRHSSQRRPSGRRGAAGGNSSSQPGDIVLDLFGGSGSTLIACEQTLRVARLSEIDPKFATVIITRWEKLTNQTAKLVGTL